VFDTEGDKRHKKSLLRYLNKITRKYDLNPQKVVDLILEKYPLLEKHLWKDIPVGYSLMNSKSEIANKVIPEFMGSGVPILSWHDGFLVPQSQHDLLLDAMARVFCDVFDTRMNFRVLIKDERLEDIPDFDQVCDF
jgi:hypothetical protein